MSAARPQADEFRFFGLGAGDDAAPILNPFSVTALSSRRRWIVDPPTKVFECRREWRGTS
jgi:hypothetical protein